MPTRPMEDAPPIRVAVIGYGYAGRTFHVPLLQATAGFTLACIVSNDAAKVHADLPGTRVLGTLADALADPCIDLVVIATPNDTHASLACRALRAGKHVVVDKPFALTLHDARELVGLAGSCERVLAVFQNRRWDSDFLGVRELIDDNVIGDIVHLESHIDRFRPDVRDRWRERDVPGGGIWYDLGPHLVDQAVLLFGIPDSVSADIGIQRDGGQAADWAHVLLHYGRLRVVLHASMLVAGGSARFTVHGTRGSAIKHAIDAQESQLLRGLRPGDAGWGVDEDPMQIHDGQASAPALRSVPAGNQSRFYGMLRDALRGDGAPPVTGIEALAVMAVLEAAIDASRQQRSVTPALSDDERNALSRLRGST